MARNRMIRPEFWEDEKLSKISIPARLVYIGIWNFSDDFGVVKGNVSWLKSRLFPYEAEVTNEQFGEWVDELKNLDRIKPFDHNGERFFYLPKFLTHQKINRPNENVRNPSPPDGFTDQSLNDHGTITDDSMLKRKRNRKRKEKEKKDTLPRDPSRNNGGKQVRTEYPEWFESFWTVWPDHKRKQDKKKAFEKLSSLIDDGSTTPEKAIEGVKRWKTSEAWNDRGGEFIPTPIVWINNCRFDEQPKQADAGKGEKLF